MTEISLEQVYSIVDSFFKHFEGNFLVEYFKKNYYGMWGFKCRLSPRDIISLNLYRFFMQISNLKAFHRFVKRFHSEKFPDFPNYENFLKASNRLFPLMVLFVNAILAKNREKCRAERVHFADSTPQERI